MSSSEELAQRRAEGCIGGGECAGPRRGCHRNATQLGGEEAEVLGAQGTRQQWRASLILRATALPRYGCSWDSSHLLAAAILTLTVLTVAILN